MTEKDIAKNLLLSKNCDTCFHRGIMIHRAERKYDTPKYCIVTKNNTCENWEEIPEYKMSFFNNASIDGKEINNIRCSVTWKKK